jgi:hypothetical protein
MAVDWGPRLGGDHLGSALKRAKLLITFRRPPIGILSDLDLVRRDRHLQEHHECSLSVRIGLVALPCEFPQDPVETGGPL